MKSWLKQQLIETTAWAGLLMILAPFIFPWWLSVTIGILLIASDDQAVQAKIRTACPALSKWIDEV